MSSTSLESASNGTPQADALLEVRRAEAVALLAANQRSRARAGGVLAIGVLAILAVGVVGIATDTSVLAIPLPTLLLLISAELFQIYADVTVLGTARRHLEGLINAQIGGQGMIYESIVAGIRKKEPLVLSERLLQAAGVLVVLASMVLGAVVAWGHRPTWVQVLYPICTGVALIIALLSYRAMMASGDVADRTLHSLGQ